MKRRLRNPAIVAGALALVAACTTNPYTHRSQLLLGPESQDLQLGAQAYAQVLHDPKIKISQDPREVEPVKRVAARIIEAAKASAYAETAQKFDWEVNVIKDDKTMNAFALPGGKIAVYTGIFPVAKNEAGLAAILGHEVTHALARHGVERMSQGMVAQFGMAAAGIALESRGTNPALAQATMAALGLGVNVGVLLPFGRSHESEADYIGLLLAAQAGYDPREAVHVWERMEQASKGQPPEFLSTHPAHGTRIKQLEGWMPEALSYYRPPAGLKAAELPRVSPQ
jgi:predicted Zn-dependent protease